MAPYFLKWNYNTDYNSTVHVLFKIAAHSNDVTVFCVAGLVSKSSMNVDQNNK